MIPGPMSWVTSSQSEQSPCVRMSGSFRGEFGALTGMSVTVKAVDTCPHLVADARIAVGTPFPRVEAYGDGLVVVAVRHGGHHAPFMARRVSRRVMRSRIAARLRRPMWRVLSGFLFLMTFTSFG